MPVSARGLGTPPLHLCPGLGTPPLCLHLGLAVLLKRWKTGWYRQAGGPSGDHSERSSPPGSAASPKCSQPPSSLSLWTWIIRGPEGAAFCLLAAPSTRGRAASRGRIVTGEQEARARAKEEGGAGGWVLEPGVCVHARTRVYVSAWEGGMVGSLLARGRACGPHPEVRNQHLVRMWYVWGTPASGLSVDKDLVPREQRVFIISPNNHPAIGRMWLPPQGLQQAKKPPKQRQPRVQASVGVGGVFRTRRTEAQEGPDGARWAWTWAGSACPGCLTSTALYAGALGAESQTDGQTDGQA